MVDTRQNPFSLEENRFTLETDEQNLRLNQLNPENGKIEHLPHSLIKAEPSKTEQTESAEEEEYRGRRPHRLKENEEEEDRSKLRKEQGVEFINKGKEKRREEVEERQEEREESKEERWKERKTLKRERDEKKEERKNETDERKKKREDEKEDDDDDGTYITQNGIKVTGKPENGVYEFHKERKKLMVTYKDGTKNGPCLTYNQEGTLVSRVHYIEDQLDGPAVQYYPNGKEKVILHYKDNLKDGPLITHSSNGMKLLETTYVKNIKEGKFTAFDMFGDIAQVSYYKNNVRHGPATTYFPKSYGGHICRISNYKDGLQVDVEQVFYTTGEEMQSTTYDQGRALNYPIKFDKSGKVLTDPAANKNRNSGG